MLEYIFLAIFNKAYFSGAVDSNDSFNSNLLIEPGQDMSTYPSSSGGAANSASGGHLPPHHLPPGFPNAPNPGGYVMAPRKKTQNIWS